MAIKIGGTQVISDDRALENIQQATIAGEVLSLPTVIGASAELLHTINNPNADQTTNTGDNFGISVDIDGNRAIVGAMEEDIPYTDGGTVYIFDVDTGELLHTINNPNQPQTSAPNDNFGRAVAISGNRAIVGAREEDIPYTDGGTVYIFDVDTAALLHTINNPNADQTANTTDYFGHSVDICGNRAIVGAYLEDLPYENSGTVYIIDVDTGTVLHTINNPNADQTTNTADYFGYSVAISGNRAIVGAFQEDIPYSGSGTVYIFDVDTGELLHTINNPNADQSANTTDYFGWSVALDGNRAIVGARNEDIPYTDSGAAYIFDVDTGELLHTINNPNADQSTNISDWFGWSVGISGKRAVVSTRSEDTPYTDSGAAYIFDVDTGELLHTIIDPNANQASGPVDYFGESAAISGSRAIFGAWQEDIPYGNSGSAYIFRIGAEYDGSLIEEVVFSNGYRMNFNSHDAFKPKYSMGQLLHTIAGEGGEFGGGVAISGKRAIVGARYTDLPYTNSGSVYIIDVDTGAVLHTINNPNADQSTNINDLFSWNAVDICGNRAIVGAVYEDVPFTDSGSVYIIDVDTGNVLRTIDNPNADQTTNTADYFGWSVAISGNRAIVGARNEDIPYTDSGTVYVFDVDTGELLRTINNPNADQLTNVSDLFGYSVALDGNIAIVGANQEDIPSTTSGTAYIIDINTGRVIHTINNPNVPPTSASSDQFGASVDISGNRAIVGVPQEDIPYSSSGAVYIIDVATGEVLHTIVNPNANQGTESSDVFGLPVSIDGNRAIVGAQNEDIPYTNSGTVYIIDVDTGEVLARISNPNADQSNETGDAFGRGVGISGNRVIVGAPSEDLAGPSSNTGAAYIFSSDNTTLLDEVFQLTKGL